jgi:tyrosine-protein phosphatase SIW14
MQTSTHLSFFPPEYYHRSANGWFHDLIAGRTMIPRPLQIVFGFGIAALVLGGPFVYQTYHNKHLRNIRIVKDGVLYRSAQLTIPGLQRMVHDYRIKTVVSLRFGEKANDQAEEKYCQENGINFVRIPPRSWTFNEDGEAPASIGLAKWREVMADEKNYPVLLHCFAGTHRTGAYVAVYRMDFEGWTNEQALHELRGLGYVTLDEDKDVFEYLSTYRPSPTPIVPVSRPKRSVDRKGF